MARVLQEADEASRTIALIGNNSKRLMAGPVPASDITISTTRLDRVLQYEPNDLTISVEAGMRFSALQQLLASHRQMIALDPPFSEQATVGGVIAANSSGAMRRLYGTPRDLVIGMKFAMLNGKIISSGGIVVKNVAGLDMGKLLIGSFGTLAVMTSINFRLHAMPEHTSTFLFSFNALEPAIDKRNWLLRSVLRPIAVDLLSPPAAVHFEQRGYILAIRAGGSRQVLDRYAKELHGSKELRDADDQHFWALMREFPAEFLRQTPGGIVIRVSTTLSEVASVFRKLPGTVVSRAGSGVSYVYLHSWESAHLVRRAATEGGWSAVVEWAPDEIRASKKLWFAGTGSAETESFAMMRKIKSMFDPKNLLNRYRLYGRL
ncbi:MAG: FAD-binding oxidoreductase [Acidobacteriaceae bacterium]|nr:FAD-binding oxidoreductase [Acidobacteriaceae bacterium]